MEMDSSSPPSSLRHRLRATVCCCFGGEPPAQWGRRRAVGAGRGEFRYDPLSYALNFDEGAEDDETSFDDFGDRDGDGDGGLLIYHGFSSSPPHGRSTTQARAAAVAAA